MEHQPTYNELLEGIDDAEIFGRRHPEYGKPTQSSSSEIPINAEIWYILTACHQDIFDLHGNYYTERLFDC